MGATIIYTDGSWTNESACWAAVFLDQKGQTVGELSGNLGFQKNRQISGECEAAVWAIKYAIQRQKRILIRHDLEHIAKWCKGVYRAKDDDAKRLVKWFDFAVKLGRVIEFEWVKGHSGEGGNERADELAAKAANLPVTPKQILTDDYVNRLTALEKSRKSKE